MYSVNMLCFFLLTGKVLRGVKTLGPFEPGAVLTGRKVQTSTPCKVPERLTEGLDIIGETREVKHTPGFILTPINLRTFQVYYLVIDVFFQWPFARADRVGYVSC